MTGRPTVMTEEVREEICEKLAEGKSLRSICRNKRMPAMSTVLLAVVQDRDGFSEQYLRAREAGGFSHADRVVDVVNQVQRGTLNDRQAMAMLQGLKWAAEVQASKHHSKRREYDHKSSDGSMTPSNYDTGSLSDAALTELMNARRQQPDTD